ncbi:2Fe-2S iron-sulfur cluster-binding protein [Chthonobacter rhizosphaerae]|uniref:2Fe-2S iron-sulfur cluster-binding protein n=1 Tax=Chthonobacter rhizosphaerae TaxID=2735553 RepID=UPI0015EFDA7D|nr:2Fe-2S iron-sulfur cluster binding domain-containing protein [Chthonobacter rhizosphaerae]
MSGSTCTLTLNGKPVVARPGDTLLDAALAQRVVLPHDCCSGQCESCRVRVISGEVDSQGTLERGTVLGCLATVEGDAVVEFDAVPLVRSVPAVVERIRPIGLDLLEVRLRPDRKLTWLPGQYVRLTFNGFPPRDYSPTFPFDLDVDEEALVFHIRRYPGGAVSENLGGAIKAGHKVRIRGPFGNAFLRRQPENLVLASTGTGFAPVWAIAVAALKGQPGRRVCVIAGARTSSQLYMGEAAAWLRANGALVVLTAGDGDGRLVRRERPAALLSFVRSNDVVYAAGSPSHVDLARSIALAQDAMFYADPFYAAEKTLSLTRRLLAPIRRATHAATKDLLFLKP